MVLFIIVCIIAWGVCRFKKSTLFIGIASIFISLTQTETYKNVNYYISHGKLSAYSKENAETEDDSYTDFSKYGGSKLYEDHQCRFGVCEKNPC